MSGRSTPLEPSPEAYERRGGAKHARKPIVALDERGRAFVEYLAWGCADPVKCEKVGATPGAPLSIEQAGKLAGLSCRNARFIAGQPVFRAALTHELDAMRTGAKPAALRKVIELAHEEGEGTAADRKVNLQAASAILGDAVGAPPANPQISVNVNNGVQLAAGVVVRLPADMAEKLEANRAALDKKTTDVIAHEPQRSKLPLRTDPTTFVQTCLPRDDDEAKK